jgi:hypothetical protein
LSDTLYVWASAVADIKMEAIEELWALERDNMDDYQGYHA